MSTTRDRSGFAPTTHAEIEADRRRRMQEMLATTAGNASQNAIEHAGAAPARNGTPALSGLPLGLGGQAPSSGLEPPVYRKDGSVSPRPQAANRRKRRYAGQARATLTDAEVQLVAAAWIGTKARDRRCAGWRAIACDVARRATGQGWGAGAASVIAKGKGARASTIWPHARTHAHAKAGSRWRRLSNAQQLVGRICGGPRRWTRADRRRVSVAILERLARTGAA